MGIKSLIEKKAPRFYQYGVEKKFFIDYKRNKKIVEQEGPEALIRKLYMEFFGKQPDLDNPQTFNEKLQWLKLYWYDERARICADKNLAREYVKQKGFGEMLINQLAVYENVHEIDLEKLPNQFVLKPSHDSGHTVICKNKSKFNLKKIQKKLNRLLEVDYEFKGGEWGYATPRKTIVCEEYLESAHGKEITDYKFYCFNGEPKFLYVSYGQYTSGSIKMDFYDLDWKRLDFKRAHYQNGTVNHKKPECFQKLIECAQELAKGFPFVRIDFMENNDRFYFGEFTFFPGGGLDHWQPNSIDNDLSNILVLPAKSNPSPWEVIHPELKLYK